MNSILVNTLRPSSSGGPSPATLPIKLMAIAVCYGKQRKVDRRMLSTHDAFMKIRIFEIVAFSSLLIDICYTPAMSQSVLSLVETSGKLNIK